MAGNGNHYRRQLEQLEAVCSSKRQQLTSLEKEHALLQSKEKALQNAIQGIEGQLSLTKAALEASSPCGPNVTPAPAHSTDDVARASSMSHSTSQDTVSSSGCTRPCSFGEAAGVSASSHGSKLSGIQCKDAQALLWRLNEREGKVQDALQSLGCCDTEGYTQLYTTRLVRKACATPARAASYLAMSRAERLQYISEVVPKMALLLGKYDINIHVPSGSLRAKLDHLVDELYERVVVCNLWDPPDRYMSNIMTNLETGEFEPYPEGWWLQVMQAVDLSQQQKAALKLVWDRIKVATGELTQQYEQALSQLQQEHMQQAQQNREFTQQIQQLPALKATQSAARKWQAQRQQQQQRGRESITSGLRELSAAAQQQHQQQQANHHQQLQPLQQLHDAWQHEAGSREALTQPLMAQLAAELQQEQHLRQQAQQPPLQQQPPQGWGGSTTAAPLIPGPAWAGGVTAPGNTATAAGCVMGPPTGCDSTWGPAAAAALYPTGQAPSSSCYSQGPCPMAVAEAADTVSLCGSEAARGGLQSSTAPTPGDRSITIDGLSLSGGRQLEEAEEVLLQEGSVERRALEQLLQSIAGRVKVLNFCQTLHMFNTLARKQLGTLFVQAYPFIPDALSMCEALDELGWDSS